MLLHQCIQFISLLLLMLVTGVFWGPWFSLHRSIHVFKEDEFIHIVKTLAGNLAVPMKIMMPACIVFLLISVRVYPHKDSGGFYLSIMAVCLIIVSLLITMLVEVPIVSQIQHWTVAAIPADWEAIRDRWLLFHVIRTIAAILSFAAYVGSILFLQ
jgi:uncharacterized membrane protein